MKGEVGQPGDAHTTDARWPDRVCLPLSFDPARLRADLATIEADSWTDHFVPQHYDGTWSVLPLRAPVGVTHPILRISPRPDYRDWEDTEWLGPCRYFQEVRTAIGSPVESMRLMRLAPGSVIKPHRDDDLDAEHRLARLHIPIVTNAEVDFRLNGLRVDMAPGSVWYLRLADTHSVTNAGDTDRIHLVIDVVVDERLDALLDAACAGNAFRSETILAGTPSYPLFSR